VIVDLAVRPPFRRRGLGRALVLAALHALRAGGVGIVRLHTVAEFATGARHLYEGVGFRVVKEHPRYRKPLAG
jgi:ribosomal protein S18 acetylase RimI-like enzyme